MGEDNPQVELNIEYSDDETRQAILCMFSSPALELAVKQTLRQAGIEQPVIISLLITPLVKAPADQLWLPPEDDTQHEAQAKSPVFVTPPELATNLGDIVISWPTVLRQAAGSNTSPAYELLYLLSHGTLHLVGYDDQSEAGYQAMVHLQQSVLQALGQKATPA